MIRHVAMFTWTEEATDDQVRAFASGLATMPVLIDGIVDYVHGDDLQLGPGTSDYVLVADFATVEDYRHYAKHPDHLDFIARHVKPIAASIHRVQYHVE